MKKIRAQHVVVSVICLSALSIGVLDCAEAVSSKNGPLGYLVDTSHDTVFDYLPSALKTLTGVSALYTGYRLIQNPMFEVFMKWGGITAGLGSMERFIDICF